MREFYLKPYVPMVLCIAASTLIGRVWRSAGADTCVRDDNLVKCIRRIGAIGALIYLEFVQTMVMIAKAYVFELEFDIPLGTVSSIEEGSNAIGSSVRSSV
ncbi:hypothetical protein SB861_32850 [Paraburkholderia sp. SIMBA_049]